jgi:hypothetical protein
MKQAAIGDRMTAVITGVCG